jgi:ATP-binding protein involved in chromosome partitioning
LDEVIENTRKKKMTRNITEDDVIKALDQVEEPELHASLVSLHMVQNIVVEEDRVAFDLILTTPACPLKREIEEAARNAVMALGVKEVSIQMKSVIAEDPRIKDRKDLKIKNVIAVASGKGGVGKSTLAVNIAIALSQTGARVGLMDADIYGPNTHTMLGVDKIPSPEKGRIIPAEKYGIKLISIGLLVDPQQPLIWRGPMLHSAIQQFVMDVEWKDLDYLIVDLPPGTGDAQISLSQVIDITAGIIVTLPQKVSVDDARRAARMFEQLSIPIIGVVENMSYLIMPDGDKNRIFGEGGGEKLATEIGVPFLGSIPIDSAIRAGGDSGQPVAQYKKDKDSARMFTDIACQIAAGISRLSYQNDKTG